MPEVGIYSIIPANEHCAQKIPFKYDLLADDTVNAGDYAVLRNVAVWFCAADN